jgi:hypothetical protein
MKSFIITALLINIICLNLVAQITDSIIVGKIGVSKTYRQNGQFLTHDQLSVVLKSKPESAIEYNKSESNGTIGAAFIAPVLLAGALDRICSWILVPALTDFSENDNNVSKYHHIENIAAISAIGLLAIGIPFIISSNSHLKKSIIRYNGIDKTARMNNISINIGFIGEGVGVRLRF